MRRHPASNRLPIFIATVVALAAVSAHADDHAHMVRDFNPGPANTGFVGPMSDVNGLLLFVRSPLASGRGLELWSSGGSDANTIRLGPGTGILYQSTAVSDRGYFLVVNPAGREEWWSSDGSVAGTRKMTISGDFSGIVRSPMVGCDGRVFLLRSDAYIDTPPYRLWRGDGNSAQLVATLSHARNLTGTDHRLFFVSHDDAYRDQLWSCDPRSGSTALVRAFAPGGGTVTIDHLVGVRARLFFSVAGTSETSGLWCSDGTPAGTIPLGADHADGGIAFRNQLLFHAFDEGGQEPWISDGTRAGTHRLADIVPGAQSSDPTPLIAAGDQAFFACNVPGGTPADRLFQLWRTDGSVAGTRPVHAQLSEGALASFAAVGRDLFFTNADATAGPELWRSDGTASGTRRVTDINPGPADSGITRITAAGGRAFMQATDGVHGHELWCYETATVVVRPAIPPTAPQTPPASNGRGCGAGSGIAGLLLMLLFVGLRRHPC